MPAYSAIVDATKRNTPQADINLVYGIAKLYDPTSVVREGEYATVANSPNIPERVKGWAQYLQGGGKLTPEVKNQILQEASGRINSYESEYAKAREGYVGIAKARMLNPDFVIPPTGRAPSGSQPMPKQPSNESGGKIRFSGDVRAQADAIISGGR